MPMAQPHLLLQAPRWVDVVVPVALGILCAVLVRWIARRHTRTRLDTLAGRLGHELALPAAALAFAGLGWAGISLALGHGVAFLLLVAAVALTVDRLVGEAANWHLRRLAERTGEVALQSSLAPLARQLLRGVLLFIVVVVVLGQFRVNVSALLTTAGVASLALALAAQDTLANFFAGVVILFDRPFRVGDRVELAGVIGDVVEIGLRSTRIRSFNQNLIIIPNKDAVASQITNRSYPNPVMALQVNVGVGYATDIAEAKRRMLAVARACPEVLADPAPAVYFTGFGESALTLQMWAYVGDYRNLFSALDRLNEAVLASFREAGIELPFPQRVVTLLPGGGPPVPPAARPGSADAESRRPGEGAP